MLTAASLFLTLSLQLGPGVLTVIPHATFYVVLGLAILLGSSAPLLLAAFALAKSAAIGAFTLTAPAKTAGLAVRLTQFDSTVRKLNALYLAAFVGAVAQVVFYRVTST